MCQEALRVAKIVVTKFVFDEIEAAENFEESADLGEAWERENYLKSQIFAFKVSFLNFSVVSLVSLILGSFKNGYGIRWPLFCYLCC